MWFSFYVQQINFWFWFQLILFGSTWFKTMNSISEIIPGNSLESNTLICKVYLIDFYGLHLDFGFTTSPWMSWYFFLCNIMEKVPRLAKEMWYFSKFWKKKYLTMIEQYDICIVSDVHFACILQSYAFSRCFFAFEIGKNSDLKTILVTPKIFLKSIDRSCHRSCHRSRCTGKETGKTPSVHCTALWSLAKKM